ncbi:hypothetical protein CspeluHIS016_0114290 [Cutaneotrichosporon spelunceum]|uniref:Brain protein I3 n=1 Tax=Cutaneotrichosporon spelunceum TaxID=1672016 RepID=A0AAD3TQI5_9TREE|nr:hypothetical protein CspeluHIS016_0114290 [Cutaneotrichosporon spelunceum]
MDDLFDFAPSEASEDSANGVDVGADVSVGVDVGVDVGGTYGTQPMKVGYQTYQAPPQYMVSNTVCRVTGGAHREDTRMGALGILIAICFCPIGCIALCLDEKRTCRDCGQVTKEAWGGC